MKMNLNSVIENAMINERVNLDNLISDGENLDEVLQKVEYMKEALKMKQLRNKAKEIHPYSIGHSEKSGWYTDVKETPDSKRKKVIRTSEEALLDFLVDFYKLVPDSHVTLSSLYPNWYKRKQTPYNQETMRRYQYIWKAYYENEPISKNIINKSIDKLTKKELRDWAEELIRLHKPTAKKFNNMFSLMAQLFKYADEEEIPNIDATLWSRAKGMINRQLLCPEGFTEPETQIFTDEEILFIQNAVRNDMIQYKKQASTAGLQILFMIETALRIGEACGLQWKDVDFKNRKLFIRRQANNERVKLPKTQTSIRRIALTDDAINILQEVKAFNAEHNYTREWIFQSDNPKYDYRLSYNAADRKLRKLCSRMSDEGIPNVRSPHKLRKTTLSLLCESIDIKTAQQFAGHSDCLTTQKFYYFDRSSEEERNERIRNAICFNQEQTSDKVQIIAEILKQYRNLDDITLAKLILKAV